MVSPPFASPKIQAFEPESIAAVTSVAVVIAALVVVVVVVISALVAVSLVRDRVTEDTGGGCSGYQYGMAIARDNEADDIVLEQFGVRLVVDPESAQYLAGAEIDYVDDIMKSGFSIFNPNATKSCACGSSFQTADSSGQPRACC